MRRGLYKITKNIYLSSWKLIEYIPKMKIISTPYPASLVTVQSYIAKSETVIIVSSNTSLLETITPCLHHSNMLLGPPSAWHVKLTVELKLVKTSPGGIIETLPDGDTTEMYEFINRCMSKHTLVMCKSF